jgi:uncharacterized membrane protein YbhN (UPF0104 family)
MSEPRSLPRMRTGAYAARLLGLAVAVVALWMGARGIDWTRVVGAIATAAGSWLGAATLANLAVLACWAEYWGKLTPSRDRVSYWRMFEIVSVSSAIMNTIPFLAGHAAAVAMLTRRGKVTAHDAVSLLALDQLGEGIAKMLIFTLAALLMPLPGWMRTGVAAAACGVAGMLGALLAVARARPRDGPSTARRNRGYARLAAGLSCLSAGLEPLRSANRASAALIAVLGMKLAEALAIVAVQRSFGVILPTGATVLVLAAVTLGTMIPLAPGNVGTYEASVFAAYRYVGIAPEQAVALALVQHVCMMIPAVGVGSLILSAQSVARRAIASR